jgi:hypothetical protein
MGGRGINIRKKSGYDFERLTEAISITVYAFERTICFGLRCREKFGAQALN